MTKSNRLAFGAAMLVATAFSGPSMAQFAVAPLVWTDTGSFTLYYHGPLEDGTVCPPSVDRMVWSLSYGLNAPDFYDQITVAPEVSPELQAPFRAGTFCSLAFDGAAKITQSVITSAEITPDQVSPPEMVNPDLDPEPLFEGHMAIVHHELICAIEQCPPGPYVILADTQEITQLNWDTRVTVEDQRGTTPVISNYLASTIPFTDFDGAIWTTSQGLTISLPRPVS